MERTHIDNKLIETTHLSFKHNISLYKQNKRFHMLQ